MCVEDNQLLAEGRRSWDEKNYQRAILYFDLAGRAGYPEGYDLAGKICESEFDDLEEALQWYKKAIECNFASSMTTVGWLYHHGLHFEENFERAMYWYGRAARLGDEFAMYLSSKLYEQYNFENKDYKRSAYWLRKSAEFGLPLAMKCLGVSYAIGKPGFKKDFNKAVYWLKSGLRMGLPDSTLPDLYFFGTQFGVGDFWWKYNRSTRKYYLEENVEALIRSDLFEKENQNICKALSWYKKFAREEKDENSMGKLSYLYEHGFFVKKDKMRARFWHRMAIETERKEFG